MLTPARSDTLLDARYNGMVAAGAGVSSPSGIKSFIAAKRAVILSQLAANNTAPFEIQNNGGNDFSVSNNIVVLSGRGPMDVASIEVNGVAYSVSWNTTTNWSLVLALAPGTNTLLVQAYDSNGKAASWRRPRRRRISLLSTSSCSIPPRPTPNTSRSSTPRPTSATTCRTGASMGSATLSRKARFSSRAPTSCWPGIARPSRRLTAQTSFPTTFSRATCAPPAKRSRS